MVQIQIWNILGTTFFVDSFFTCKIRNPNSGELRLPEIRILLAQGSQIRLPVPEVNSHLRRPLLSINIQFVTVFSVALRFTINVLKLNFVWITLKLTT